tara:strand:- start:756 stop:914 length:159 start_codon:yes stop_codon:yes gene_type:complete
MEKNSKQKLTEDQKAVRKMLEQERAWAKKLEKIDDRELTEHEKKIKAKHLRT